MSLFLSQMRHYSAKYGVSEFPGEGISFTKLTMDTMNDSSGAEIKVSLTPIWFVWNFLFGFYYLGSESLPSLLSFSGGRSAGQQELILRA